MDINVKSPFFLTQALLPLLEASASAEDPARTTMVGSVDGLHVSRLPTFSHGPSKMTAATIDAMGEQIRLGTPLKHHGQAEDMAGVAIYLASRAASFVMGVVVPVDGGITSAKTDL